MTKKSKVGESLKNRLYDLASLATNTGIVGIIEYFGGFSIDHPLEDIAIGAGLSGGEAMSYGRAPRFVSSIVAAGLSMYTDFAQLAASGDTDAFLQGAGIKAVCYGAGAFISGSITYFNKSVYDGLVEVHALFKDEAESNEAFEYLQELVKAVEYISTNESAVHEPQQTEKGYRLHARMIGVADQMQSYLRPSLESYFSNTLKSLETKVSDVVITRRKSVP